MNTTTLTATAEQNVVTGRLVITVPGAEDIDFFPHRGQNLGTLNDLEPWGVEENDLDRADQALADMGWIRTGEWVDCGDFSTAAVTPR